MNAVKLSFSKLVASSKIGMAISYIKDPTDSPVKCSLYNKVMPSPYYISLVSFYDETIDDYIDLNNLPWPNKLKRTLFNKIDFLNNNGFVFNKDIMHGHRACRNSLAHEPERLVSGEITWKGIDILAADIGNELIHLILIITQPKIEIKYQRDVKVYDNDELGPQGERLKHIHEIVAEIKDIGEISVKHEIRYGPAGSV